MTDLARRIYDVQGGRQINDEKYRVICPAHDDSNPSLSVKVGDYGKLLVHCHAGCEYRDVMNAFEAKGINVQQRIRLTSAELASKDGFDEQRTKNRITAERAKRMWSSAPGAVTHAYLEDRAVEGHGIRVKDGELLIPMRSESGHIWNLQRIFYREGGLVSGGRLNGEFKKLFMKGGKTKRLFHAISGDDATIYICEGYADAASIFESTGYTAVTALSASNLPEVADAFRERFPDSEIIIAEDVDGPGKKYATKAALRIDAKIATPSKGSRCKDFNDVYRKFGAAKVRKELGRATKPQSSTGTPLRWLTLDELLKLELPPRSFLLEPWLQTGALVMVHAERGRGKTFFALSTAISVASGRAFGPWETPRPYKVAYIDGEMPAVDMQERMQSLSGNSKASKANLKCLLHGVQSGQIPDLATVEGQKAIEPDLEDVDLIILDNLSTLVRSGIENEAESWQVVQDWLIRLRSMGKTVLLVHHSGKKGAQRGTSKREDVMDVVIKLQRTGDYTPEQGARFRVEFEKARNLHGPEVEPISLVLKRRRYGGYVWEILEEATTESEIKTEEILRLHSEGKSQSQIASIVGKSQSTVSRTLKDQNSIPA